MTSLALFLASGDSFFVGAGLLALSLLVSPFLKGVWSVRARNVLFYLGLIFMAIAAPPFPWLTDIAFLSIAGVWLLLWNRDTLSGSRLRFLSALALLLATVTLSLVQFSHRQMPVITGEPGDHLVVIGDSLSAGLGGRVHTWPFLMQRNLGVPVKNLVLPGATTAEARTMAGRVTPEDRVVLLEIGGNDVIAGVPCHTFANNLESVLQSIAMPRRTIVMFELPVLPHQIRCGQSQRQLAAQYHIFLIPKHYLTEIIGAPGSTTDGLHLSEKGSERFAAVVQQALRAVLRKPAATA